MASVFVPTALLVVHTPFASIFQSTRSHELAATTTANDSPSAIQALGDSDCEQLGACWVQTVSRAPVAKV